MCSPFCCPLHTYTYVCIFRSLYMYKRLCVNTFHLFRQTMYIRVKLIWVKFVSDHVGVCVWVCVCNAGKTLSAALNGGGYRVQFVCALLLRCEIVYCFPCPFKHSTLLKCVKSLRLMKAFTSLCCKQLKVSVHYEL